MRKIFLLAFLAAVLVTAWQGGFHSPERWEYSEIADNLLAGRGMVYHYLDADYYFYGPTVYPLVLAGLLAATRYNERAVLVFQAVLFGLTAVLMVQLAQSIFGPVVGVATGILMSLDPGNLIYAGRLHAQTIDVFLMVLFLYFLVRWGTAPKTGQAFVLGLIGGIAGLSRATILPILAVWGLWFIWHNRLEWRRGLRTIGAAALGCFLILSPLLVRSFLHYQKFILLRTDSGVNLWYGNHPGASGTSYTLSHPPQPVLSQLPASALSQLPQMNEMEQNNLFSRLALDFIREHPKQAFLLFLKKIYYFWWFSPHAGLFYPAKWLILYRIFYAAILLCAAGAMWLSLSAGSARVRETTLFLLAFLACVSIAQAIFYIEGRHRWQVEPILLMFAGAGIVSQKLGRQKVFSA